MQKYKVDPRIRKWDYIRLSPAETSAINAANS